MAWERIGMRRTTLEPEETYFEWDQERGLIRGPAAEDIQEHIDEALRLGSVSAAPYPTGYYLKDPLHIRWEMAVLLSSAGYWSKVLSKDYPKVEDREPLDLPPGFVY